LKQGLTNATDKDNLHYEASKLIYRLNMIKGYQQYQDWDLNKAKAEAEEAYNFNQQPVFTLQKADCQFALKQYAEAFESYQEVNTSSISSPQTFGAAAISAEMAKMDSSIVLAMLDSAVNFYGTPHPKSVTMYLIQRATHLDKYGRYKEAAKDYQEVEDLSGTKNLNDNFFYLKSLCDTRARLYMRALTDIEKALSMKPDDYLYLVEKALAQWRMGNYDEAVYAGQKALKINPNGADAYKAIGLALGEQKKTAEAIKHLTKAKELGDPQAEALIQSLKDK
jgi:tetratricopeptide (TPR) repeat protein